MKLSKEQVKELSQPLAKSSVSKRKQGNMQLSYIEGHHAISEANRIFGFDGWSVETNHIEKVFEEDCTIGASKAPGVHVGYRAQVRVSILEDSEGSCWGYADRTQNGFGSSKAKSKADAHELAIKEAETDAMKRALRTFGNQFGNSLYDAGSLGEEVETVAETEAPKKTTKKTTKKSAPKKSNLKLITKSKDDYIEMIDDLDDEEQFINFRKDNRDGIKALPEKDSDEVIEHFKTKKAEVANG